MVEADSDRDVSMCLGPASDIGDGVSAAAMTTGLGMETFMSDTTVSQVGATQSSAFGEDYVFFLVPRSCFFPKKRSRK